MAKQMSVWLVPGPRETVFLEQQIERCSRALGSPPFPPHVTLCSDPAVTRLAAVGSLRELPLSSTFTALEFGDDYFHGCYLRANDDQALRKLQAHCVATLGGAAPRGYPPHLSLAYGVLSEDQRATAAALIVELPVQIAFDRLELWETSGPVSSWCKLA
jgi:2'-5' RNA ligase